MSFNIGVVGTGYVGLVTGTCLADVGNQVLCIDVDAKKVERLRAGDPDIFENGLELLLKRNIKEQRLSFSLDLEEAVRTCSILMYCLPTPPGKDGQADLAAVMMVARKTAELLNTLDIQEQRIIVNKSTVPVGTTKAIASVFAELAPTRKVQVVSNPEFLSEGMAVDDFMKPDRIVIGTQDPATREILKDLYQPFIRSGAPVCCLDEASAEVTKYAANTLLATKISFMNDLSRYCEVVGADIDQVRIALGADSRVGRGFLYAGVGYGGSCFPKDVKALIHSAAMAGTPLRMAEATEEINAAQIERFAKRITDRFGGRVEGRHFAFWGLSFKPNTDDVRDAPSIEVIKKLLAQGASVSAFDPEAMHTAKRVLGNTISYAENMYHALKGADALVIVTEWNEFRNPSIDRVRRELKEPLIFDGRNLFALDDMHAAGFEYHSVGRVSVVPAG